MVVNYSIAYTYTYMIGHIYAVWTARNRIISEHQCVLLSYWEIQHVTGLQNDHKSIMKLIEDKIHQLHEEAHNKQNTQMNKSPASLSNTFFVIINNCGLHKDMLVFDGFI